jgi:prepilin-type N-terminal cleavage/methylation domain-containing protein
MLSKFHKSQKGFTLIELMIVVVIIGILAALAIPRFMRATTKAKQSEAKTLLKQIYTMEQTYRQANDAYWPNPAGNATADATNGLTAFAALGVEVGSTARYSYALTGALNTFSCVATANLDDDATIDTWTINEQGQLVCTPGLDDSVD